MVITPRQAPTPWSRLAWLCMLYFCQGMPYGFQATALPALLREEGMDVATIGLLSLLAVPWMLKVLWAPLVDAWGSERFGPRKSWIVPMQLGLAICCFLAIGLELPEDLGPLLGLVLVMNLLAATQDIAVDGLAVELLEREQLGLGNAGQVVGYKVGMLTGGGLLVWAASTLGWAWLFGGMGALMLAAALATTALTEPRQGRALERVGIGEIARALRAAAWASGGGHLLALVGTYKLGETVVDAMFKPFLVDAGLPTGTIGLYVGTWGMVASLLGSALGGLLATRGELVKALVAASLLRTLAMGGQVALVVVGVTEQRLLWVTCAEHLFGGTLTTVMFAFMMSRVDRRIGATHFTLLATVEVLGKMPGALLSGFLVQSVGYLGVFVLGTGLSLICPPLALWEARARRRRLHG